MPRTNVWLNDDQVDELRAALGKGVNVSGCIRAGLALLLDHLGRDRTGRARREAELLSELSELTDRAEAMLSPAARRRLKRGEGQ